MPFLVISATDGTILLNLKQHWVNLSWTGAWNENNLTASIPQGLFQLKNLTIVKYSQINCQNKLTGSIPQRLFQLKNLSVVWLFRNQLSGEIPIAIESPNLIGLDLSENNLTGEILTSIESLNLNELDLSENNLTGSIPMDF
ncbi:receptor-like protein 52 [Camellia sinensis]|uniref:receptor-like protein 52 n=1 Tax=Camellia sinensis TaxID=4442 RepID=UPI001036EEEC|nr:receptor-like protein 52 [Camellia sinensis]